MVSRPNCLVDQPRQHAKDASLEPPSDFVAFLSQVRQVDCESAALLLSKWLEHYKPLQLR